MTSLTRRRHNYEATFQLVLDHDLPDGFNAAILIDLITLRILYALDREATVYLAPCHGMKLTEAHK